MQRRLTTLLNHGVSPQSEQAANTASPIAGKTIVVTGTLPTLGRRDAETLIEQNGAKAAGSVSKKTPTMFSTARTRAAKLDKARELNIPLLTEPEFLTLLGMPQGEQQEQTPVTLF